MSKISFLLAFGLILLLGSLGLNGYLLKERSKNIGKGEYLVSRVVDGDTLILGPQNMRVRLGNVEAPELTFCGGKQASERLSQLTFNKKARVEFMGEDNFNRSIVFVFVDGKNINQALLDEGLVRYDGSPSPYRDQLRESYQSAMAKKLGIFGMCRETESLKKDCQIKGNIDKQQASTKIYYFPGCSAYAQTVVERDRGEEWFCSEASAGAAGYVKSKNCFGRSY